MTQATLVEDDLSPNRPEGGCLHYAVCENMAPGGVETGNELCADCLSFLRNRDRKADYSNYTQYLNKVNNNE